MTGLSAREEKVLTLVVERYIATHETLSSRLIASIYTESDKTLSSATVRNVLHLLEEKGYLVKPHLSAGRVPTRQGFRFYINRLVEHYYNLEVPGGTESSLSRYTANISDTRSLLIQYLDFLKNETGFVSFLLFPSVFSMKLSRIEFVRLSARQVMIIVITKSNLYRQILVEMDRDVSYDELVYVANYLNRHCPGKTLAQIRQFLINSMRERVEQMDRLAQNILKASFDAIEKMNEDESELLVRGVSNLVRGEEAQDLRKLHELVASIEDKYRIVELINACMDKDITVLSGAEIGEDFSMVVSPYGIGTGVKGAFGLVGPLYMDYRHVFSTMKLMTGTLMESIMLHNMSH